MMTAHNPEVHGAKRKALRLASFYARTNGRSDMDESLIETIDMMVMFHNNLINKNGPNSYWTNRVIKNLESHHVKNIQTDNDGRINSYDLTPL